MLLISEGQEEDSVDEQKNQQPPLFSSDTESSLMLGTQHDMMGATQGSLISLLADSDSEEDTDGIVPLPADVYKVKRSSLTKLQEELIHSIESMNLHYFVDLGGVTYYDINFESKNGFPLKIAAAKGSEQFVCLMLENKMIEVNKKDKDGLNSFWIACRFGHGNVMRVLSEKGSDVLVSDSKNNNVLHIASKYKYRNIIEMLVKSKFPLDLKTTDGDTAVHIAAQKGNLAAI